MAYTKDQLYEKFQELPDEIQDSFLSVDTFVALKKIGDKYKLHIDEAGKLSEEIGFVMLGITRPENFLTNIQNKLGISLETAGEIAKDVNLEIFFPIRESLRKIHDSQEASKYQGERAPLVENFSPTGNISDQNISRPETPLPNPNNNAIIIDNASEKQDENSDKKIFDEKMSKLFRLPKEEVELGTSNQTTAAPASKLDPYREPVN